MIRWIPLALVGIGCACPSPQDIAIVGGAAEERAILAHAVADFAEWTGRDSICVAEIEVLDALEEGELEKLGSYHAPTRRVEVLGGHGDLYTTTIHELCHAVDKEDGWVRRHRGHFDYDPNAPDYEPRSVRSREREAFAVACEGGPLNLEVVERVVEACHPDLDLVTEPLLREEVFAGSSPPTLERAPWGRHPVAEWTPPDGMRILRPVWVSLLEEGTFAVVVMQGELLTMVEVDLATGVLVGPTWVDTIEVDTWSGMALPHGWRSVRTAGWGDGRDRLLTFHTRLADGTRLATALGWDGEGLLWPDEPCVEWGSLILSIDAEPWLFESDGTQLAWSRWGRDG